MGLESLKRCFYCIISKDNLWYLLLFGKKKDTVLQEHASSFYFKNIDLLEEINHMLEFQTEN